jgi:hypothetical protein
MDPNREETQSAPADQTGSSSSAVGEAVTEAIAKAKAFEDATAAFAADSATPRPLVAEEILLIWEEHPENTTFHRIPYEERYLTVHGKLIGMSNITEQDAEIISEIEGTKGQPVPTLKLDSRCRWFLQTGIII